MNTKTRNALAVILTGLVALDILLLLMLAMHMAMSWLLFVIFAWAAIIVCGALIGFAVWLLWRVNK